MKKILLCLHGWGGSSDSFTELRQALNGTDIEILTPDLPGFGDEPEPKEPWTTDDYMDWVVRYVDARYELRDASEKNNARNSKLETLYVVGHSHGGRIAIKLAAEKKLPIAHLFLCAAAGIRHPRHFRRIIGLTLAKTGKLLLGLPGLEKLEPQAKKLLYRLVRVHDYERASPVMGQTLINVSREDLRPFLPMIDIPTDIFWGSDDHMTPMSDGYLMEKNIEGSTLHVYQGVRHRVHRDKAEEIAAVIKSLAK